MCFKSIKQYIILNSIMQYKRLKRDIADILKNPLSDEGIYYIHDEQNFLNGYALICGPKDTPYENGYYFFYIKFPQDYPASPPKVTFYNKDKKFNTRFHPNLYRNGKVCLSIINTWKGEGWTSCVTLRTVLLTMASILNENPLTNEPGISEENEQVIPYNEIITFRNLESSIYDTLSILINNNDSKHLDDFLVFKSIIIDMFNKNYNDILKKIEDNKEVKKDLTINIYNMFCSIDYTRLDENIKNIKIELENI